MGLAILYGLLTKRFPYLGAVDFDGYELVKSTNVTDAMLLMDFISQILEVLLQAHSVNSFLVPYFVPYFVS